MDELISHLEIPKNIALTRALKENIFSVMVCAACKIPLIMVGEPGSSKTLSVTLVAANMRGEESAVEAFRNTSLFPSVELVHYQCSRKSTSEEISRVFVGAELRQKQYDRMKMKRRACKI